MKIATGSMPSEMTAKRLKTRVGPEMSDNSMNRTEASGQAFYDTDKAPDGSRPKMRDGDESVAMAAVMGNGTGPWAHKLNEGSDTPYPETPEALKMKNTRKNNDIFFP